MTVYLALGSNKGDRVSFIRKSLALLGEILRELRPAFFYETKPQHYINQALFVNTVCTGMYDGELETLFYACKKIEEGLNRKKTFRFGPRTIDIDILLFGSTISHTDELQIPHPRMLFRSFVLKPLVDLHPESRDPSTGILHKRFLDDLSQGSDMYLLGR